MSASNSIAAAAPLEHTHDESLGQGVRRRAPGVLVGLADEGLCERPPGDG